MSAEKAANALAELRRKLEAKQKAEREALGKEEQAGERLATLENERSELEQELKDAQDELQATEAEKAEIKRKH